MRKPMEIIEKSFFEGIKRTYLDYLYDMAKLNARYVREGVLYHAEICIDLNTGTVSLPVQFHNAPRIDKRLQGDLERMADQLTIECPECRVRVWSLDGKEWVR